ncbi:putative ABC transport system permease protein [Kitasatospora sp. SolWspMP-SS2h]|uniref:FtsX-like permease family protein n=1 Tax=Kitasatospora sp. SolWspMP-SS2h TaxID=1305729 RepID=UPI000DB928EE|nr:FtsX-like permease family protein [Kitasatospora sp. SolWspMP-SS2h]RAJ41311.1 putative ABC transport system permease protein [Kitasatospora sp. SolWspMP-SS2h]
MKPTAWRAALRIARRDAARAKGRSALVLAMIALPVLGVAGVDVIARSAQLEPAEKAARQMGTAQAAVTASTPGGTVLQSPDGDNSTSRMPEKDQPRTPAQQRSATTDPAQLLTELLPGAVLVPTDDYRSTSATTKEGRMSVTVEEADLTDPVWKGKLNLVAGTAPTQPDQLVVTRGFLDRSGLRVGDRTAFRGLDARPYTITAVAENPARLDEAMLYGRPGSLLAPLAQADPDSADSGPVNTKSWLVKLPGGAQVDWPKVKELNDHGFTAVSRTVLLHPPARAEVPYYAAQDQSGAHVNKSVLAVAALVPGMALLEIVLLAGPAFAVGARRSRRQLGLLAAGGGDRSHVRAVVLAGGAVLGTGGAVLGLLGGVGLVGLLRGPLEEYGGQRFGHLDVQPLDLLAVALVGLVTGLLAAVVPAVQASRQDVVEALTGRGGSKPANRLVALLGAVMVAGGTALALLCAVTNTAPVPGLLGGSVIAEIGMLLCTPLLIGLFGRLGRHLPLSPRLALRDSVRHRGRTAPAVAAVMAAVAGAVAVGVYHASDVEQQRRDYRPTLPAGAVALMQGGSSDLDETRFGPLRQAVEQDLGKLGDRADVLSPTALPGDCRGGYRCGYVQTLKTPERRCPADDAKTDEERERAMADARCTAERALPTDLASLFGDTLIGGPALLHNLLDLHDPAAEQALAAGKVLVLRPDRVADGRVTLRAEDPPTPAQIAADDYRGKTRDLALDAVEVHAPLPFASAVMSPETARRAGLGVRAEGALWKPAAAPADSRVQKATAHVSKLDDGVYLEVEQGFRADRSIRMLGLTAFAALVALGAAGIATGLAAADSQQDLATLAAVGASGGIRRRLSGFQCGVIAAMGTVLGLLCGAVPAVALRLLEARNSTVWADGVPVGHQDAVIAVPWADLAGLLIGLPLVAVLLAAALTRSGIGLTRRAG